MTIGIESEDRLVGAVLDGRFRLERLLGAGGMGRVYVAEQTSVEREVAVKILEIDAMAAERLADRFLREAKIVSSFTHPNIVRVIDFGRDAKLGALYLVMELVDGVPISRLISRGRLRPDFAVEIAYQVCGALVEAHSKGIIHRDLKPDNLLVVGVADQSLQVKVLDFGIAFARDDKSLKLTKTGAVCGTVPYMAPEQARSQPVTERSDLYALGVLLYEMLTGELPFVGDSPLSVMVQHVEKPPPPIRERLGDVDAFSEAACRLVEDLLAKQPDDRPESALEVRRRIEHIRSDSGVDIPRLSQVEGAMVFDEFLSRKEGASKLDAAPDANAEVVSPFEPTMLGYPPSSAGSLQGVEDEPQARRTKPNKMALVIATLVLLAGAGVLGAKLFEQPADANAGAAANVEPVTETVEAPAADPVRLAVLYIEGEGDQAQQSDQLIDDLTFSLSQRPEIQWIDRTGILDLLAEEGIDDPAAIERVEKKACSIARRGNLDFSLVGKLEALDDGWRLRSKIICTESRSIVAAFEVEGASTEEIAEKLVPKVVGWVDSL